MPIPFPRSLGHWQLGNWENSPGLSLAADVLLQFLVEFQQTLGAQRFRNTMDDPRVIRGTHLANPRSRGLLDPACRKKVIHSMRKILTVRIHGFILGTNTISQAFQEPMGLQTVGCY
jgi:hypothetical protein